MRRLLFSVRAGLRALRALAFLALPRSVVLVALPQVPGTDIVLVPVRWESSVPTLGAPRRITNRPGYDNQPSFSVDGESILFTSIQEDGQADIYRYDLAADAIQRLTDTPESEYSPTPIALFGPGFSTVRVERDSAQRLWWFPDRGGPPRLLLPGVRPVGYHAWGANGDLLLYVLGTPPSLYHTRPGGSDLTLVARNVGRSLRAMPGRGTFSYVALEVGPEATLMEFDPVAMRSRPLAVLPEGAVEVTWTAAGEAWTAVGARILRWRPGAVGWDEIGRVQVPGLGSASRLTLRRDGRWLAVVLAELP